MQTGKSISLENSRPSDKRQITIVKAGRNWVFKHYFMDRELFLELAEYYDEMGYRFVLRTPGERNMVQKILCARGFEVIVSESTKGYAVKLDRKAKYAPVLKNSMARIETPEWRIFLMKDQAAVKDALRHGAKLVEVEVRFN